MGFPSPNPRAVFSLSASLFYHLASLQAKPPCLGCTLLVLASPPVIPTARTNAFSYYHLSNNLKPFNCLGYVAFPMDFNGHYKKVFMKNTPLVLTLLLIASVFSITAEARERSLAAKNDFKYAHPCPSNGKNHGPCPGYVIDHITALACGGADAPTNMQWQSVEEGKAKDKWERKGCQINHDSGSSYSSGIYQTGPKGGCYTYTSSGKKKYVAHSKCGR